MKFDPKHSAIKTALNSAKDARGDVSEQTRFGAIRTFGEKLSDAIGEFANRPRQKKKRGVENQEDYLKALLAADLLSSSEYQDFDIVREIGNKGAHGLEIYPASRTKTLAAFERLAKSVEAIVTPKTQPDKNSKEFDADRFFRNQESGLKKVAEEILVPHGFSGAVQGILDQVKSAWERRRVFEGAEAFLLGKTTSLAEAKRDELIEERRKKEEARLAASKAKRQKLYAALGVGAFAIAAVFWFATLNNGTTTDDGATGASQQVATPEPQPYVEPAPEVTPEPPAAVSVYNSFLVSYLSNAEMRNYRLGNSIYDINVAGSGFTADSGTVRFGYLGDFDGDVPVRPEITLKVEGTSEIYRPTHCFHDHSPVSPVAGQQVRSRTICGFEVKVQVGDYQLRVLFNGEEISGARLKVKDAGGGVGHVERPARAKSSESDMPVKKSRGVENANSKIECVLPGSGEIRVTDEQTCRTVFGGVPYQ